MRANSSSARLRILGYYEEGVALVGPIFEVSDLGGMFVNELGVSGELVWGEGYTSDDPNDVAIDPAGRSVVTGNFSTSLNVTGCPCAAPFETCSS